MDASVHQDHAANPIRQARRRRPEIEFSANFERRLSTIAAAGRLVVSAKVEGET